MLILALVGAGLLFVAYNICYVLFNELKIALVVGVIGILLIVVGLTADAEAAPPSGYCDVTICNKLERITLSPWSAMKDYMGEQCMPAMLGKEDAVVGKILDSHSRWYQGSSINPTKRSVTRVKEVKQCSK